MALYLQFCWSNVDKTRWSATFSSSVVRNCQRLIRCWWNISDQYCCWINMSKITRSFFWYEIKRLVFLIMGTERSCYWWISLLQLIICHKLWRGNAHPNTLYISHRAMIQVMHYMIMDFRGQDHESLPLTLLDICAYNDYKVRIRRSYDWFQKNVKKP